MASLTCKYCNRFIDPKEIHQTFIVMPRDGSDGNGENPGQRFYACQSCVTVQPEPIKTLKVYESYEEKCERAAQIAVLEELLEADTQWNTEGWLTMDERVKLKLSQLKAVGPIRF